MKRAWTFLSALAILASAGLRAASAQAPAPRCTQPLRVALVDVDLGVYLPGQGGQLADPPGLFVQWVRREAARLGCAVTLQRLPPARLLQALSQGDADIGIGLAPTREREAGWVFPRDAQQRIDGRLALLEAQILLYAREDRQRALGWDGRRFAAPAVVGGAKGSAPLALAQERGWKTVPVMSTPQGLKMLRAERFDVLVAPSVLVEPGLLQAEPRLLALQPPLVIKPYFAPVSPAMWQRQPELVKALWRGLCRAGREHAGHSTARCDAGSG